MRMFLFKVLGFPVSSYYFFYGLGCVAGCVTFERLCRWRGVRPLLAVLLGATICLVAQMGSHFQYVIERILELWPGRAPLQFTKGGYVLYGGVVASFAVCLLVVRVYTTYRYAILDALPSSAAIGLVFGRIGCFLGGCCWGVRYDGFGAVCFPRQLSAAGDLVGSPAFQAHYAAGLVPFSAVKSLPVFPAQLISSAANFAMFVVFLWLFLHRKCEGRLAPLYLMVYASARWAIELTRINERFGGLSIAQWTSMFVFLGGLGWWICVRSGATNAVVALREPIKSSLRGKRMPKERPNRGVVHRKEKSRGKAD